MCGGSHLSPFIAVSGGLCMEKPYVHDSGQTDIRSALNDATRDLVQGGSPTPRLDAEVLLSYCIRQDRLRLYAHPEDILTQDELQRFQRWIVRRRKGEPVAYITGKKEFWSLSFEVNRNVLIPRPETELLVESIVKVYSSGYGDHHVMILDIGTGSGAISVALASELKNARIVATDISQDALAVAMRNSRKNGVSSQISFRWGSLFEPVSEKFDVIVSNPPYISEDAFLFLPRGVREFEPELALVAGRGGTAFHRDIIAQGYFYLKEGGRLFIEMGADQKDLVSEIFKESAFYDEIAFIRDHTGVERAFTARRKRKGLADG